ncbi:MAG: hypothetical protein APR54_05170 [Candidatus Cloacimonas sp. SDB]|nr:MAG: hypothetical protein APR54_05170 [Candidatus Cloacimonas sp. SDB]
MYKIVLLPQKDRNDLFKETANRMHVRTAIVEKDFWVVWTLDKLFTDEELSSILMFKGGTSLSKVFGLIERFSEDIDLILNWELLAEENPNEKRSKTQQDKFNKEINELAKVYIEEKIFPQISKLLEPYCKSSMADDGYSIKIQYPSIFRDEALLPYVLLEIGPLSSWFPYDTYQIISFAAKEFPEQFSRKYCNVKAIIAERTFWEKATILHQQANRPDTTQIPLRYSRHYYDLAKMALSSVKNKVLEKIDLLFEVADFKKKFYICNWAKYEDVKTGNMKLVPPDYRIDELKKDYISMKTMIFGKKLELEEILKILKELETEANAKVISSL